MRRMEHGEWADAHLRRAMRRRRTTRNERPSSGESSKSSARHPRGDRQSRQFPSANSSYEDDCSAHRLAFASACSWVAPTSTMPRSGLPLPSREIHAIQCGPRASLWIWKDSDVATREIYQISAIFALRRPGPSHRIDGEGAIT